MNVLKLYLVVTYLLIAKLSVAQRFVAENGEVIFISKATIEDIKSENKKINSIFNAATGNVAFSVPIRDFKFEKQLMQEHFNDKYMESQKYPNATFAGKVTGFDGSRAGVQPAQAVGKLTVHGVTKDIEVPGTIEFSDGQIILKSSFKVTLSDYGIKIPQLLWQNIAEKVAVNINLTYKQQ